MTNARLKWSSLRLALLCLVGLAFVGCIQTREQIADPPSPPPVPPPACVLKTCTELGASCGAPLDGCGGRLSCGGCAAAETCGLTFSCVARPPPPGCTVDKFCLEPGQLTAATLLGVYAADRESVWAVGDRGTVLHRENRTWRLEEIPGIGGPDLRLWDVHGFGPENVWIVGDKDTVLHRSQGVWTRAVLPPRPETSDFRKVFGRSENDLYFLAERRLLHSGGGTPLEEVALPAVTEDERFLDGGVRPDGVLVLLSFVDASYSTKVWTREPLTGNWSSEEVASTKTALDVCPDGRLAVAGTYSNEGGGNPHRREWRLEVGGAGRHLVRLDRRSLHRRQALGGGRSVPRGGFRGVPHDTNTGQRHADGGGCLCL